MKKTYPLAIEGKHPDRVLDAVKHDIRKYLKRERRRPLPEGVDFLDFDCRFGPSADTAQTAPLAELIALVDTAARDGATQVYVELLAKPGHRKKRPPADGDVTAPAGDAPGNDVPAMPADAADLGPDRAA
jgi:hypothetical protein